MRVFAHTPAVQSDVLAVVVEVVAPSTYFTEYSVMDIPVAFETLGHCRVTDPELRSLILRLVGAGKRPAITVVRIDSEPAAAMAFD